MEDNVLGSDTLGELALDVDAHVLGLGLGEGLGSEDVLDLGGSDTEGEGAEGTVGRSVRVTADNSRTGEGEALLGTNNVDDTLALVAHAEVGQAELLDVLLKSLDLGTRVGLVDERRDILEGLTGSGPGSQLSSFVEVEGSCLPASDFSESFQA